MLVALRNVEIIREFLEADPDVEWHPPPDIPNAAIAIGRDALIANFQDWLGAWDDYRSIPEEILEGADDTVLMSAQESARGKDSGIEVRSRRFVGVYELSNGRIVRYKA